MGVRVGWLRRRLEATLGQARHVVAIRYRSTSGVLASVTGHPIVTLGLWQEAGPTEQTSVIIGSYIMDFTTIRPKSTLSEYSGISQMSMPDGWFTTTVGRTPALLSAEYPLVHNDPIVPGAD
ncbi:hypothetical protein CBL_05415 [Carabus blaptoides fortunei]